MISNKNELEYQKLVMPYYKNFDETLLTIKIQHRLKYGHRSCDGSVKMSTDKCCFSHNSFVHIDTCIGGEGYHYVDGVMSGFEDSLNIQSTEQGGRQIHERQSTPARPYRQFGEASDMGNPVAIRGGSRISRWGGHQPSLEGVPTSDTGTFW